MVAPGGAAEPSIEYPKATLSVREILRNLSLKAVSLGLERGGRLLVAVAAAGVLGQTSFGQFVFASTVTAMLALGTDLGLAIWTTRALARADASTDGVRTPDRREGTDARTDVDGAGIVGLGLALRAIAILPYVAGLALAVVAVDGGLRASMLWLGVAALLNMLTDHFAAILRGSERFAEEARLNALRAVVATATGLTALGLGRSLDALCAGMAAASVGGFAYGLARVMGLYALGKPALRLHREKVRDALRQSLPIWLAGLVSLVYFRVDTIFLHAMSGDAELGAYGAAYKFFEGGLLVPAVVLAVTFPRLARTYGDEPAQRQLERQLVVALLGLGLFVAAVLFLGRAFLIRTVFGAGFYRAEAALSVLALGLPVLYVNFGLTHFLVARNQERATTVLALMMLVLNLGLDVSLIPGRGGPGAAWATVLSELALTLGCLLALRAAGRPRERPSARGASRTERRAA
jgi:O-antigen/teichoic acid export membrane protein